MKTAHQHNTSARFTFTAKAPREGNRTPMNKIKYSEERDPETGFSYFGARYYDPEISTLWLSVNSMADKYTGISPYAYCVWNPVRLVDPDGNDVEVVINHKDRTVTVKVDYFVDAQHRNLVAQGLKKWNDLSGQYACDFGTNYELKNYLVIFDLKVAEENDFVSNGNWISFVSELGDDNVNGTTKGNMIQLKEDNIDIVNTIAHEVGHSIGLTHHNNGLTGLMEEDGGRQSGNRQITPYDTQSIINKAIRKDNRNDGTGYSRVTQCGHMVLNFCQNSNVSIRKNK